MESSRKFYITTAISYSNGLPHIGHAYETIAADVIARFKRLDGYDVFFMTGTDEHGQKVQRSAEVQGLNPESYVSRIAVEFRAMNESLNCSFDRFIRTSNSDHLIAAQELWKHMETCGDIYLSKYSGWYSIRDETFYTENETKPCEDGTRISTQGTPVEWTEEESYFFRLSAYQEKLLDFYEQEPNFIQPVTRRNEIVSFVKRGLEDLSVSRTTFNWGLAVPGHTGHIMYVWVDALSNYLTGCGFPDYENPQWHYWPPDVQIIGKDIIRFHAIYWPAFLISAGLPLPKVVFGHGFLLNNGKKISKSVGNVIDPFILANHYGTDQLRYFLLRDTPFGQDGNYSHETIIQRINADLANDLGNLAQRSLSMISQNLEGKLPRPGIFKEEDKAILNAADSLLEKARRTIDSFAMHSTLEMMWDFISMVNGYFTAQAPWRLKTEDISRMKTVLYITAESLRQIAILLQPFMPTASGRLLDLLGVTNSARCFAHLGARGRL
ncbi:MAG: methionine--tRNA ligase, partial [Alphaproteobacteria bacterium]|nr:methionine--tRNA ligase [Alphaproteobacteria bacterium]